MLRARPRPADRAARLALTTALELPPDEQKARIANYAQMAFTHDKKNLVLLRSAVRTERDPLVRLMAADALFRIDAESGTGPLLEALPPGGELLARLRRATRGTQLAMPVIPSLLDLAAEGNSDAFARLLALCGSAHGGLARALADGLADVADASPDETLAALKVAPLEQARAAAELIGAGFAAGSIEMDDSAFAQDLLVLAAGIGSDAPEARRWVQLIENRGSRLSFLESAEPESPPTGSGG